MEERRGLRLIYTVFLGVLIALFVGLGINTFYPGPTQPTFPTELNTIGKEPSEQQIRLQSEWDKQMAAHNERMKPYNRNVAIIALVTAVTLLVISIVLDRRIKPLGEGLLIGGLLTLLYSIGRGFASEESRFVFVAVTISLIVVLYVGYHQFGSSKRRVIPVKHQT